MWYYGILLSMMIMFQYNSPFNCRPMIVLYPFDWIITYEFCGCNTIDQDMTRNML